MKITFIYVRLDASKYHIKKIKFNSYVTEGWIHSTNISVLIDLKYS